MNEDPVRNSITELDCTWQSIKKEKELKGRTKGELFSTGTQMRKQDILSNSLLQFIQNVVYIKVSPWPVPNTRLNCVDIVKIMKFITVTTLMKARYSPQVIET